MRCPLCAEALDGGELVMVCQPCHQSLGASLDVSHTGEFKVVPTAAFAPPVASPAPPVASGVCAWCGKHEHAVRKLLGRDAAAVCDECIALACDILDAELGTWR